MIAGVRGPQLEPDLSRPHDSRRQAVKHQRFPDDRKQLQAIEGSSGSAFSVERIFVPGQDLAARIETE
jgi:hypothetical protein